MRLMSKPHDLALGAPPARTRSTAMFSPPARQEIDHRAMKLIVGLIALSLASITSLFSHTLLTSISAAYYQDGPARNFLVGFLFAISSFLLAYNGRSRGIFGDVVSEMSL